MFGLIATRYSTYFQESGGGGIKKDLQMHVSACIMFFFCQDRDMMAFVLDLCAHPRGH
jgi:hypothetical protein